MPSSRPVVRFPVGAAAAAVLCIAACSGSHAGPGVPDPTTDPAPLQGWTQLVPSAATRHVFLSSSSGSDTNNGLAPNAPVRSISAALALLRHDHPDWLHIKRGDQFEGSLGDWILSGRSAAEPMVVTSFGNVGDRPSFRCGTDSGLTVHTVPVHDVAFVGLHFRADVLDASGSEPFGISLLMPCTRVLIEDCAIERFFTNVRMQGPHQDIKLRRSVITDAFTMTDGHSQGIYVDGVDGCRIEECVFDHNGWSAVVPAAVPTIYRHDIYIQGNTSRIQVVGNIIARAGSHGLQARSGGEIRDNLFLANPINLLVGNNIANGGAVTATVLGNVIMDSRDISANERRGWGAQFQCFASGEIAYNVVAHRSNGSAPQAFTFDSTLGVGVNRVDFHDNIAYRWGAPMMLIGDRFADLVLRNNDLQELDGTELFRAELDVAGFTSARNRLFSGANASEWMFYNYSHMSLEQWKAEVGDQTSVAVHVPYPRPELTIADFDLATGGAGSLESFLARARRQARSEWNEMLVGSAIAAAFRANFGARQR